MPQEIDNSFEKDEMRSRLVVFVGGFDPRGARHYHQLMRLEAGKQKSILHGLDYSVGKRKKSSGFFETNGINSQWSIFRKTGFENIQSEFVFFDWHDEVQKNWPEKRETVFWQAFGTYAAIWRLKDWLVPIRQQARFTLWALMYPLVYVLLLFMLGVSAGLFLASYLDISSGAIASTVVLLMTLLVGGMGLIFDRYIHVSWLLRILNFAHLSSKKEFPVMDQRIDSMAEELAIDLQQERWREVVIVGFSVGTVQAVKLAAALSRKLDERKTSADGESVKQEVSLVTLGNCIPLFGLFPGAKRFRSALRDVAQDRRVYWADISSPSDSVCFGMCDVVGLSLREDGVRAGGHSDAQAQYSPGGHKKMSQWGLNPQAMCSPRFHKLFRPETYRWLRRNKMRMHFQYLMAGEVAGAYDYFELLTTPGSVRDYIEKKLVR